MRYQEFIGRVEARSGLTTDQAEQAAHSFFEMLGVFMNKRDAKELASVIPLELRDTLNGTSRANPAGEADGFFEHIGTNHLIGHHYSQAVWDTLKESAPARNIETASQQLPGTISQSLT